MSEHRPWHVEVESWRGAFSKPFFLYHVRSETGLIAKVFTNEDDATLIAVAPKLLAAAKHMREVQKQADWGNQATEEVWREAGEELEAAIKKAERGEA